MRSLDECASQWDRLGLELNIPPYKLDAIKWECNSSCEKALRKMLQGWLHSCTNPTWGDVVQALKVIGLNDLASKIEKKYCLS